MFTPFVDTTRTGPFTVLAYRCLSVLFGRIVYEPFFVGHFPGNPVMPGVLQIEALAQTGGILAINNLPTGDYDTYFVKIDNCKFKHKVIPGDTMILKMELMGPIRRGLCEMHGTVYVGNKIATEADLMAQLVKRS